MSALAREINATFSGRATRLGPQPFDISLLNSVRRSPLPSPVYSSFFPLPCPLSGRTFWTISEGNLSWSLPPIVLYSREERVSKHRDDVWQVSRTSHLFNRRKMFLLSLRYARAISFSSRTCADMCPCTRCFLISKTASTVVVVEHSDVTEKVGVHETVHVLK